jgi:hypothetical protein
MQLLTRRCSGIACLRPFQVTRVTRSRWLGGKFGQIVCPNCGETVQCEPKYIYMTARLTPKQEALYEQHGFLPSQFT